MLNAAACPAPAIPPVAYIPNPHLALPLPAGLPPPVPRKATGLVPHHRSVQSHGGEMRLSPLGSSVANLQTGQHSYVRPEHRSAVLLGAGPAGSKGGQGITQLPQLLQADGPTGPAAAWLLDGTMQQQLALPLVEAGKPICLWWRVTAGAAGNCRLIDSRAGLAAACYAAALSRMRVAPGMSFPPCNAPLHLPYHC